MITGGPDAGDRESAAVRFSRFGRLALAGLLAPSIVRTVASAAGVPLRGALQDALVLLPPILFAAAAGLAASPRISSRRTRLGVAAGFFMAGLLSAFAYDSLQGLTGREPAGVTVAAVTASFAAGFALATGLTALAAGTGPRVVAGAAARGLGAGACGGLIALAPFLLSLAGAAGRVAYLDMALAVAAAFGCVLVPFRLAGAALDAVWPPSPPAVE
jgi:hypothetical protein